MPPTDDPLPLIEAAWAAFHRRDWDDADRQWAALRARFPAMLIGYAAGVTTLREARRMDAAEALACDMLARFPNEASAHLEYGWQTLASGDLERAFAQWDAIRARFPDQWLGFLGLARAHEQAGQTAEADAALHRGVEAFPDRTELLVEYAAAATRARQWEEAVRRWDAVRQRAPDRPAGLLEAAHAHRELEQFDAADALLRQAVEAFPNDPAPLTEWAALALRRRDWAEAVTRYQSLRERHPDQVASYGGGIQALRELARFTEAQALAEAAIARFPNDPGLRADQASLAHAAAPVPPVTEPPVDLVRFFHALANPRPRKRIVLLGNCQAQAMAQLYRRFVAARTGDLVEHVASYEDVTTEGRAALEQADLIVEQLFDLKPKAETGGIVTTAERLHIPMITGAFLWPFAGQPHPHNQAVPWLSAGPYGGESTDSYLNRLILARTPPEEALETYMNLNVASRVNLDRLFELVLDRQKSRDAAAGYDIAGVIEAHFRTEPIFLSPYHPNRRIALALATRMFEQMGAEQGDIERLHAGTRVTPFPKTEMPIHPGVARHYGLAYAPPERRYQYMNTGKFTTREYAWRYLRYEWNAPLEEGMHLTHTGQLERARTRLTEGLSINPASAPAHAALGHVLAQLGDADSAIAACRHAIALDPEAAQARTVLAGLLRGQGLLDEAETEMRAAVAADPTNPHPHVLLAHLCRQRGHGSEAHALIQQALALDPYAANLHMEMAYCQETAGDMPAVLESLRWAVALTPDNAETTAHFGRVLRRQGQLDAAEAALRRAVSLAPDNIHLDNQLNEILKQAGRARDPIADARRATVLEPASVSRWLELVRLLTEAGDLAGAEVALREAIDLDPRDADVRISLSDVLIRLNRVPEAVVEARVAALTAPLTPEVADHLARVEGMLAAA